MPFAEILRLICLSMSVMFLFISIIILFVYDSDRYETAAMTREELFVTTIYRFQSLPFILGWFVWDVLAVPYPPVLLYVFSVNNIMICSEVSFSWGLCCRKTGQLTCIDWCLYDTGGC